MKTDECTARRASQQGIDPLRFSTVPLCERGSTPSGLIAAQYSSAAIGDTVHCYVRVEWQGGSISTPSLSSPNARYDTRQAGKQRIL